MTRLDGPDYGPVRLFLTGSSLLVLGCRVSEAVAVVAGLDDVAMMRQAIQQRRGHLRIAEYTRPFGEAEIGRDQDAGFLIQLADQVKQQGATGLAEG